MKDWPVEAMAISDLVSAMADYNPRVISKAAQSRLRESLEKFGLASTVTFNKRTGRLVSGHQRVKLLSEANVDRVAVTVVDVDEQTEKALNVSLNRLDLMGDWSREKLDSILRELSADAPDLSEFLSEMSEARSGDLEELVERISTEEEWQPGSDLPDPAIVAEALAGRIRQMSPTDLARAALISVQTSTKEILVLTGDPSHADFIDEIKRAAENGDESPLERLFDAIV